MQQQHYQAAPAHAAAMAPLSSLWGDFIKKKPKEKLVRYTHPPPQLGAEKVRDRQFCIADLA